MKEQGCLPAFLTLTSPSCSAHCMTVLFNRSCRVCSAASHSSLPCSTLTCIFWVMAQSPAALKLSSLFASLLPSSHAHSRTLLELAKETLRGEAVSTQAKLKGWQIHLDSSGPQSYCLIIKKKVTWSKIVACVCEMSKPGELQGDSFMYIWRHLESKHSINPI